jgi:transposase
MQAALTFPRTVFPPRPWAPMTDQEFIAVAAFIPGADGPLTGRPHKNLRRTLDAIFWVAASRGPWRALPEALGPADTAHRTLRRWAERGVLDRLLMAVSSHPLAGAAPALKGVAYFIARAFRRMARVLPEASIILARTLNLRTAWPAQAIQLPDRTLSENAKALQTRAVVVTDCTIAGLPRRLISHAGALGRACQRLLRLAAHGNRADWKLK